jgi:alpha-D-ribose 1-methylphosphonate 5-triphosphate diphosphatase
MIAQMRRTIMKTTTILTNARLVLPEKEVNGSLVITDDRITEINTRSYADGIDLRGAILAPGVIDIHTDYLERELAPRPSARFPLEMAMHVMDLRALSCGLTTIVSGVRISAEKDGPVGSWRGDGLALAKQLEQLAPQLRGNHLVHVRWSPHHEDPLPALEDLLKLSIVGNLVFNDDIPGERQFRDLEGLIRQYAEKFKVSMEDARVRMDERTARARATNNRLQVKEFLGGRIPLGSHDDTTIEHVVEAFEAGATLSEMPVSIEAARKAKELGMLVCMGAPNYYRGGSHCGNLSCEDALAEGLVDILCSDYHFPSMLACVLRMAEEGMPLPAAFKLVTGNPAKHLGIDADTGSLETGKRADLIAFRPKNSYAEVSHVWTRGQQMLSVADRLAPSSVDQLTFSH